MALMQTLVVALAMTLLLFLTRLAGKSAGA
jgi:hypothetical protein